MYLLYTTRIWFFFYRDMWKVKNSLSGVFYFHYLRNYYGQAVPVVGTAPTVTLEVPVLSTQMYEPAALTRATE